MPRVTKDDKLRNLLVRAIFTAERIQELKESDEIVGSYRDTLISVQNQDMAKYRNELMLLNPTIKEVVAKVDDLLEQIKIVPLTSKAVLNTLINA